jgi:uncharacterized protein YgbK (DUF1537 family)
VQVERARSLGVRTIVTDARPSGDPLQTAHELADRALAIIRETECDGLIIFGGDTTLAILETIGCERLMPTGEIAPGVPVSLAVTGERRFTLVSKAGGFGSENIVESIIANMRPAA